MLHRTHNLLGGGAWSRQYVSDWWACDSRAEDAAGCAAANVTAPAYAKPAAGAGPAGAAVPAAAAGVVVAGPAAGGDDLAGLAGDDPDLRSPLLTGDNWGAIEEPGAGRVGSGARGRGGGGGGAARRVAAAVAAAAAAMAVAAAA
jgi:hypothetical protein